MICKLNSSKFGADYAAVVMGNKWQQHELVQSVLSKVKGTVIFVKASKSAKSKMA